MATVNDVDGNDVDGMEFQTCLEMSSEERVLLPGETYWNEGREQVMTEIFRMVDKDGNGTCV